MSIDVRPTSTSRDSGSNFHGNRILFEDRLDQSKDPVLNIGVKGLHL